MTVTLYNNKSASNVLNKSYTIVGTNITATAKGAIDVDRPSLLLNYSTADFNYFFISDFGRYYYVTSRLLMPGKHIMITGESDPLESFRTAISDIPALAVRNESSSNWDKNIADPYLITKAKREYHGYSFGSMQNVHSNSDATYILGVI